MVFALNIVVHWCLRDLRVQCLVLYTVCVLSQHQWNIKMVSFSMKISLSRQNSYWLGQTRSSLLKFSAQWVSTASGVMFCSPNHHDSLFIYLFYFKFFFLANPRYPILDPRSSILNSWSWFSSKPRTLFLFSSTEVSNQRFQAIEFAFLESRFAKASSTNHFLYPSNSKIYGKEFRYNETSLKRTNFPSPLRYRGSSTSSNLN